MNKVIRLLLIAVAVVVGVIALYFLFEWGGDLLDTGGVVGA